MKTYNPQPGFAAIPLFLLAAILPAQQDRLASSLDAARIATGQRVVLRGHIPANARAEFDQGAVDASFKLPAITMHLQSSAAQQEALRQALAEQQDPASPHYRQWLTPEEYADRFGVSQNDVDTITAWLQSQGFTVLDVARSRTFITFQGTAAQTQKALGTAIHRFNVNGKARYANTSDPSVPAALASVVAGFRGLNNFRMKGRLKKENPDLTLANGVHHIAPDDLAVVYDIAPLHKAGVDGTGQKIAIVGQTSIQTADITAFRNKFNLGASNLQQVLVPNHANPGVIADELPEADLDIEWAGAVARNATIVYVYSDDVVTSLYYAIDHNLAPVISMSYGSCEQSDLVDLPTLQAAARQANAQGITWLAASGDVGAADCEDTTAGIAQNGLAVDAPSSIPEVTSLGGSEFTDQGGAYWTATNSVTSGSALSYIPEKAWNDTSLIGELSASGGGASGFFPQPVWQSGPGVPNDGFRHVPDVSLSASANHDGYYVYSGGSAAYYGGTSVAAPSMAGIVALLNQYLVSSGIQTQPGVGNINPTLYRLAQNSPGVFHDIVAGDNIVPCAANSPGCTNGSYGNAAGPGYDQVTGLGSPDAYNLIHQWTTQPAQNSAVVPAIDANPVFQQQPDASGNAWRFTIMLAEEAGIATKLTSFTIDGKSYDIVSTFGTASIPARGSISSKNLGLANVAVPKTVVIAFSGVDASGRTWSQQLSVPFTGPQTPLTFGGAGNAASGRATYAPGEIVSVYGTQMGNFAQPTATVPLPNYLAGFEAMVDSVPAPLYYVSPNQVNIQIPYETQPGTSTLTLGNPYANITTKLTIAAAAPGIFSANGFNVPPFASAKRGAVSTLFITGEGQVRPSLATGATPIAGTAVARLPKPVANVTMTIGGQAATTTFVGIPSGLVGVTQINFQVPADAALGVQPIVVTVGAASSPPVNITITP